VGVLLPERVFREVEEAGATLTPLFYQKISSLLTPQKVESDDIFFEEYEELSRYLDKTGVQDSTSVRNILKARVAAIALISDEGELLTDKLVKMIQELKQLLYSLQPGRERDAERDGHLLRVLELLQNDRNLQRLIKNMSRPLSNRVAEDIIRATLHLPANTPITDTHVRRAVLHAWLVFPRQSLGSCFATAPCIIIQEEQPHLFLRDLDEMMSTGRLKRTFNGVEYSVPMCASWGNGDLKKPVLLDGGFEHSEQKMWMQPGLILACEAVGLLDKDKPMKFKVHLLAKLIKGASPHFEKRDGLFYTTAEEVLEAVLLHHHGITKKAVTEYLNRPQSMMMTGLMMHVPKTGASIGKKTDQVDAFLKDFETGKTAFKIIGDSALLKAWEFTVASFSEAKLSFARYNLYASLGVNADDAGGIGECLYKFISLKIEQANLGLKEMEAEYDQVLGLVRYTEQRIRTASTEKEIEWLKVEYQSRQSELYSIETRKRAAFERASKVGQLYDFLISQYDEKFPNYFQEVYDPDIHDFAVGPYDDSPAGFRLLYKHGRSNPAQWTRIHTLSEFTESLVSFFTLTEQEISSAPEIKGVESDCSQAITQLVTHVRSDAFLESAFWRMARAHNAPLIAKPLQNLDKVEKKPWVYTSGGSMSVLVSSYFRRDEKPTEVSRWVESETELLAFLIDSMRHQPQSTMQLFVDDPTRSMLMHSPTHAFLLKPGFQRFQEGWQHDMYTYSWIKHYFLEPCQKVLRSCEIEEEAAHTIMKELIRKMPQNARPRFRELFSHFSYRMSTKEFFAHVINTAHSDRGISRLISSSFLSDTLSSILYSSLPFTSIDQAKIGLQEIMVEVFGRDKGEATRTLIDRFWKTDANKKWLSSNEFYTMTKAFGELLLGTTRISFNPQARIIHEMRKRNFMLPEPIIFADTNWVRDYFAFVVSPIHEEIEFWSVDRFGIIGQPVSHWKMWLNGSRRDPQWGIFIKPHEYISH